MRVPLALAVFLLLAVPAVAAAPKPVTNEGVGKVKLGKTHAALYEKGLIGRQRKGCELAGPGTRASRLRAPLKGVVELTRNDPRKVKSILVTAGAQAKGVGVGATEPEIREVFPHAKFDESTEEVFGITLVKIPKRDGGRYQFALDVETEQVTLIGVPYIAFCE